MWRNAVDRETALRLHHAGALVTLSYRRDKLPAKSIKYWLLGEN